MEYPNQILHEIWIVKSATGSQPTQSSGKQLGRADPMAKRKLEAPTI